MDPDADRLYSLTIPVFILLLGIPSTSLIISFVLIVLLLIGSALISSSEVAYFSLNPNDLDKLKQEGSIVANRILELKETPRKLLATILISNNFINIAIVVLSEYLLRNLLPEEVFISWAETIQSWPLLKLMETKSIAIVLSFLITIVAVTFLLVLFGEVAPKVYAKFNNVKLAKFMARPLIFIGIIFNPLSNLLVRGTNLIESRLMKKDSNANVMSRAEIDHAIELTVRDEQDAAKEIDILKGIVKFGDVSVKQIMRSRVDVVAIDFRMLFNRLLKVVRTAGYSRVPVYDEDFDNITGILYVKDLLPHLHENPNFEWQEIIRTNVMYVPEAKKINDLLTEFQEQRMHMAIVVDEFGGSLGIVTLEDIIEEVIGEIRDEFDSDKEIEFTKLDPYTYVFEGKTLLNDVCRVIGVDTSTFDEVKGESDSFAGLILEIAGQIPKIETEINYNDFKFKIVAVNPRRIKQIKITLPKRVVTK